MQFFHSVTGENARGSQRFSEKYSYLLHKTGIPFWSMQADGSLTDANPAFLELVNPVSPGEVTRLNFFLDLMFPPNKAKSMRLLLARCGRLEGLEVTIRAKNNTVRTGLVSMVPSKDRSERTGQFDCFFKDLTDIKQLTERLMKAQKMASFGTMAGGIVHDFNNLISGIRGCASIVMQDMEPSNPCFDDVQTILAASQKASELIAHLLSYIREEKAGRKPVSVNGCIAELLKILSRTMTKGIRIRTNFFPGIAAVEADAIQIQQALMNICLNARDAMPEGGTLTVQTENTVWNGRGVKRPLDLKPGTYVRIRLRDTGIGMSPDILSRIFEPFFTTKGPDRGNGLGLLIAREIIGSHGGAIVAASKTGVGSTFDIYLPACVHPCRATALPTHWSTLPRGNETLLLVDDEEVIRKMGKRMLEKFGYNVLSAADGRNAVDLYKKSPKEIDLLIVDMVMPEMDGHQTLQAIRKINPDVKALLASGYQDEDFRDKSLEQGFMGFIPKPFTASHVLKMVRQSLDVAHARRR